MRRTRIAAFLLLTCLAAQTTARAEEGEVHRTILPGGTLWLRVLASDIGLRIQTGKVQKGAFLVRHQLQVSPFVKGEAYVRAGYLCDHVSSPSHQPYVILATEVFPPEAFAAATADAVRAWTIDTRTGRIGELPASVIRCEVPSL